MAGFQALDKRGDGLVITKPSYKEGGKTAKRYRLYVKTGNVLNQVAVFSSDEATEIFKDELRMLGVIKV